MIKMLCCCCHLAAADLESFVVDLVLLDDSSVRIVEINPFAEFAGSGLFAWHASHARPPAPARRAARPRTQVCTQGKSDRP